MFRGGRLPPLNFSAKFFIVADVGLLCTMKTCVLFLPLFLFLCPGISAFPFNSNLPEEDLEAVLNGHTLIRSLDSYEQTILDSDNPEINGCLGELAELDPKYFVEVLQIRRIKPDDGIVGKVYRVLSDVESYTEIPYHSKRHGTTTPLYSYSKIRSDFINRDKHHFTADMVMPPFELCTVEISIKTDHENFLLYKSKNLNPMTCMTFIRVKKDRLRSMISVFQHEDYWIIYGIGAAKAPKIPILTRRVEDAFISRVEAFCGFATAVLDE